MRPFPPELMRIWPISTRVNKPENDDPSILDAIEVGLMQLERGRDDGSGRKTRSADRILRLPSRWRTKFKTDTPDT
jgi:hypothetical protein